MLVWLAGLATAIEFVSLDSDSDTVRTSDTFEACCVAPTGEQNLVLSSRAAGKPRRHMVAFTSQILGAMSEKSRGLREWCARFVLEDISFLRSDGTVVLGVACSGEFIWAELADDELPAESTLRESLCLRVDAVSLEHVSPAWGEQANTVVSAPTGRPGVGDEQLPCRRIGDDTFEVCCIPFHVRGLALGDVIHAKRQSDPARWTLTQVLDRPGHAVAWMSFDSAIRATEVLRDLSSQAGAYCEREDAHTLAFDIPPGEEGDDLWAKLQHLEDEPGIHLAYSP